MDTININGSLHDFDYNAKDYILTYSAISGGTYHVRLDLFVKMEGYYQNVIYENGKWHEGGKYSLTLQSDLRRFFKQNHILNDFGDLSAVTTIENKKIYCYPIISTSGFFVERELFNRHAIIN